MSISTLKHIFVLMLENRSFDHMLGFSGITGTDAESGSATSINGLQGNEANEFQGQPYRVKSPAPLSMPADPGHEFENVREQLTQHFAVATSPAPNYAAYPPINGLGFAASFARTATTLAQQAEPKEVMLGFTPAELPVLNALAKEFAVCDNWFSSMPGPTWPNRFFAMAGSSGGLDHSPSNKEILEWETIKGFEFEHGTIFDQRNFSSRIYCGGVLCIAQTMKGVTFHDVRHYSDFIADVSNTSTPYVPQLTWIEPDYGDILGNYTGGTSQHPLDCVTGGEKLIKEVYETLRASPIWKESLLIITWDEHGGFYDHVLPPKAPAPGDLTKMNGANNFGFDFTQYGVRVPAVVVSPLIPRNRIDHRLYDHTSILATIHQQFGGNALGKREAGANHLLSLASLAVARDDTPRQLPDPIARFVNQVPQVDRSGPIHGNNLPGFLWAALRNHLHTEDENDHPQILQEAKAFSNVGEAHDFIRHVENKLKGIFKLP